MTSDALNVETVQKAVEAFKDPETGQSALKLKQISNIQVDSGKVTLDLALTTHSAPLREKSQAALVDMIQSNVPGVESVMVNLTVHDRPAGKSGQLGLTTKSIILVGSGKGGVGKSTVATCLALALKRAGCKTGLLDADIYGPSVPHLLGLEGRAQVDQELKKIPPMDADGMPVMSIGFIVPPGEAVVWRGPMLHGAVTQFLRDTMWGNLDYLVIDMPPGTGDIALTLSQSVPLTGSVVVCTPQEVALLDAVKAIAMFRKVNIPVLGVVENMSGFLCPDNGKTYDIFGRGGARLKAEELNVPFLGDVPITMDIRERGDAGETAQLFDDPQTAPYFDKIAFQLVDSLATKAAAAPPVTSLPVL